MDDEQPEHAVVVDSFQLDTFEVTVGRFRKFVNAYDGTMPAAGMGDHSALSVGWQSGWNASMPATKAALLAAIKCDSYRQTWTDVVEVNENFPINCVNWYIANAFCIWDGGRLATEAEWEYVAGGGSENRLYPWGSTDPQVVPDTANCFSYGKASSLLDVGSLPKGKAKWGQMDMGGSMWEWVFDWYSGTWYAGYAPDPQNPQASYSKCDNCVNTTPSTGRVFRGGGFLSIGPQLRAAQRDYQDPTITGKDYGIRCARPL
jgi:formylglycine-generating enzyme required for sulfatase activity